MERKIDHLKECRLAHIGRFIGFEVSYHAYASVIFEFETLVISGDEEDESTEFIATMDRYLTKELLEPTELELADFEMDKRHVLFTLTNGDQYGVEIQSNEDLPTFKFISPDTSTETSC